MTSRALSNVIGYIWGKDGRLRMPHEARTYASSCAGRLRMPDGSHYPALAQRCVQACMFVGLCMQRVRIFGSAVYAVRNSL